MLDYMCLNGATLFKMIPNQHEKPEKEKRHQTTRVNHSKRIGSKNSAVSKGRGVISYME